MNIIDVNNIYHSKVYKRDMTGHCALSIDDRETLIIDFASKAPVTVDFLADKLDVTTAAIRNDVNRLIGLKLLKDISTVHTTKLIIAI